MNIKKYHFNYKSLQNNEQLINEQINSKNHGKNIRYSDKNFYHNSMPNQTFNFKPNILLQSEQSTLFTSEDLQNKNNSNIIQQIMQRNNCHCGCHQNEETMKYSANNENLFYSHSPDMTGHIRCCHHMNNNYYSRPNHKSVEINRNNNLRKTKNFELVYNYEKMKKQYNIIWPGTHQNRNDRINKFNYTTGATNKISYARNFDILGNKTNFRYLNRSCDDMKTNDNYYDNFILRKTKKILGFTFNDCGFLTNKNRHYKPNSVNYRIKDIKESLSYRNNYLNKYGINTEIEIPNKKPKYNMNNNNIINNKNNNNNLIKEIIYSKNIPYINEESKENRINNNFNNNLIRSNSKPDHINYNNDLEENIINNISFGNNQKKDYFIRNQDINYSNNNNFNKTFDKINKNPNHIRNNSTKNNNINNNNNIDINRDIKDILKERNLFLKIKKKKKGSNMKENNLNNKINKNDDIDPNKKIIREIMNYKKNKKVEQKNKNTKNNNNKRYLNCQDNSIDNIIEKIMQKNHCKKNGYSFIKNNNNNQKTDVPNNIKIKYSNLNKGKNSQKFGISNNMKINEYKSFKDLKKLNQTKIKDSKIKHIKKCKTNMNIIKKTKTPIKNFVEEKNKLNKNTNNNCINKIPDYQMNTNKPKNNFTFKDSNILHNQEKKKQINKRSLSINNIDNKIEKRPKNKKKKKNNKDKNQDSPYLDIFNLDKINKIIRDGRNKNSILYNKIIQPYNNTKTLINNNISYKNPKLFENDYIYEMVNNDRYTYELNNNNENPNEINYNGNINTNVNNNNENIKTSENINTNETNNSDRLIKGKNEIFNLSHQEKNNKLKNSKSCILGYHYNLENIKKFTRNKSENFGNCFACFLGCSVSQSGYSPMNYSPYDKRKREDNLALPSEILYNLVKNNN